MVIKWWGVWYKLDYRQWRLQMSIICISKPYEIWNKVCVFRAQRSQNSDEIYSWHLKQDFSLKHFFYLILSSLYQNKTEALAKSWRFSRTSAENQGQQINDIDNPIDTWED